MSKYAGNIVTTGADAGYSVAFDGSGDYLSVADNIALDMGSSDFTIEAYVFIVNTPGTSFLFGKRASSAVFGGVMVQFSNNTTPIFMATVNGSSWGVNITSSISVGLNAWKHIAVTRSGTTWTVWVNGVSGGTATLSGTVPDNASAFTIGAGSADGSNVMPSCYISNFRVTKGTALYTAAFTPPTQLFNVTNTSLLTCNSTAIADQSSNAFTIGVSGNSAVSTFTPFAGYQAYNPALGAATPGVWSLSDALNAAASRQWNMYDPYFNFTSIKLGGNQPGGVTDTNNNVFKDSSPNNFTITRNGNVTQGSYSPFSLTSWSGRFDGNGDYLAVASNGAAITATEFTIEFFIYSEQAKSACIYENAFWSSGQNGGYRVFVNANNTINLSVSTGTFNTFPSVITSTNTISQNVWNHVAIVRNSSNVINVYINGISTTTPVTYTGSLNVNTGSAGTRIGALIADGTLYDLYVGYLSNLRIVNGTALYNSNFTPPTTTLTAVTNTKLLTLQSDGFQDNSTNKYAITVNGNPTSQAFGPFLFNNSYSPTLQGGSAYFDGTGDFLATPSNTAFTVGTGAFTLEAWVYPIGSMASGAMFISGTNTNDLQFGHYTANQFGIATLNTAWLITSSTALSLNAWNHCVCVRSGTGTNQTSLFLNGARVANGTVATNFTNTQVANTGATFTGYISSPRFVKGTAVYDPTQTTITVPTAPLTAVTNTSLLLNFTNAGITDATGKNVVETVGNARISTVQSKYGGSSMFFDGTGDYLVIPASTMLNVSGGMPFTFECWVYTSSSVRQNVFVDTISGQYWDVCLTGYAVNLRYNNAAISLTTTLTVTPSAWNHIAVVWNGSIMRIFVNGVADAATSTTAMTAHANTICMVGYSNYAPDPQYMNGYIQDLRITRGYARYLGNFIPPTSLLQNQ